MNVLQGKKYWGKTGKWAKVFMAALLALNFSVAGFLAAYADGDVVYVEPGIAPDDDRCPARLRVRLGRRHPGGRKAE